MNKTSILFYTLLFAMTAVFAQKRTRADRYFNNENFPKAIEYYTKQKRNKNTLENLGTSYFNIFQFKESALTFKDLMSGNFKGDDKEVDNRFNFLYYQSLSSLGYYEVALNYLKKYRIKFQDTVNIGNSLEIIEDLKLKNPVYVINKVKFNSEYSDFGAVKKGRDIVFISNKKKGNTSSKKFHWNNEPYWDMFTVKVNQNMAPISKVKPFSDAINTKYHEGNFCFNRRGNIMYFSSNNYDEVGDLVYDEERNNTSCIYKTEFKDGTWTEPVKLKFNSSSYSCLHPSITPDGKTMYLSSDKEGGFGKFDIYKVNLENPNAQLENLGPVINTPNREQFPYISSKGNLLFSSDGHLGLGLMDNFISENVKGEFKTPINLGAPINSPYDDFSLNYTTEKNGFFASNREGNDNIYQFFQTGDVLSKEFDNTFELRDIKNNELVKNSYVTLFDDKGKMVYHNKLDSVATFDIRLPRGEFTLKAEHNIYEEKDLKSKVLGIRNQTHVLYLKKLPGVDSLETALKDKKKDPTNYKNIVNKVKLLADKKGPEVVYKKGKLVFDVKPIYFKFNSYELTPKSKKILNELAKKIGRYPNIHLKITAHTDSRGRAIYNQRLSEKRAEVTRNYLALVAYINARRMRFSGKGESEPVVPCEDEICGEEVHKQNRRCEFEIISY